MLNQLLGHGGMDDTHVYHDDDYHDHHPKYDGGGYDKGKDLVDLFVIASTAIAYLSFGMFLIQLIMCISLSVSSLFSL